MKRGILLLPVLLLATGVALAVPSMLDYFSGRNDGDSVTLEWKSGSENGMKKYIIERSDVKSNDFEEIGTVAAQGSFMTYTYKDSKTTSAHIGVQAAPLRPLAELNKYRLKFVFSNEISYSQPITVTRPSSGVRRTWGMIKEMFH